MRHQEHDHTEVPTALEQTVAGTTNETSHGEREESGQGATLFPI